MNSKIFLLLPVLVILVLCTGCIQNSQVQPSPVVEKVTPEPTVIPAEPENATSMAQGLQQGNTSEPVPTLIQPKPYVTSGQVAVKITAQPTSKPDPTIVFQDRLLLTLDDMQAAKEGILLSYRAGDMIRVREKSKDFTKMIQNNSIITDTPLKMDYALKNYNEYTDQAGQFAQSFTDGATRWIASDKASANSLFDAAIMASDRADIADKRIRVFFRDHIQPVQANLS